MKLFTALAAASLSKVFAVSCDLNTAGNACTETTYCTYTGPVTASDAIAFVYTCSVKVTSICKAGAAAASPDATAKTEEEKVCKDTQTTKAACEALSANCMGTWKSGKDAVAAADATCTAKSCMSFGNNEANCGTAGCDYTAAKTDGTGDTTVCESQTGNSDTQAAACALLKTATTTCASGAGGPAVCCATKTVKGTNYGSMCADKPEAKSAAVATATGAFAAAAAALLM